MIVELPPDTKVTLQEAVNDVARITRELLCHLARLIETTRQMVAIAVRSLSICRSRIPWGEVLTSWMTPDPSERGPTPSSASRWYDFAPKYFIYGLNWARGSIIGSILERDDGQGQLLERTENRTLQWSVVSYADMLSWVTLDPISSHALIRKEVSAIRDASDIGSQYGEADAEIDDAVLEPKRVTQSVGGREAARSALEERLILSHGEMAAALTEDFSQHRKVQFRLLPPVSRHQVDRLDPAGLPPAGRIAGTASELPKRDSCLIRFHRFRLDRIMIDVFSYLATKSICSHGNGIKTDWRLRRAPLSAGESGRYDAMIDAYVTSVRS